MDKLDSLINEIRGCQICADFLPNAPKPIVSAESSARILIIGQAPGTRVQESGIPWDDPSGNRLREWMGVDKELFYDPSVIAIVPMGFCYPGKGKSGDLPPRKECAATWHDQLLKLLPEVQMTLLIGQYAQNYYLGSETKKTLTDTVRAYKEYAPKFIPTVHPSPRNVFWLKKNPWFNEEVIPFLQKRVSDLI
jgi:uracil-DNA glycosylase